MNSKFENREQAGKFLAEKLIKYKNRDPVILALPRGGVPIAHEIASKLHASLDVVLVKKIGAPGHEEFAIGAVAEDEKPILNQQIIKQYNFAAEEIENIIVKRITEIRKRSKAYREKLPAIPLFDRTVLVVDDGLATGATMMAAIEWLRTQKVKEIIVAVPVASKDSSKEIKKHCDEFISLVIPDEFWAVGEWYKKFDQVSDEEVMKILHKQSVSNEENTHDVWIEDESAMLQGVLTSAAKPRGIILFAHGGGSSHKSPRNIFVAKALNEAGFSTLLFDLLTVNEALNRKNVFDIELMTKRLLAATEWAKRNNPNLPIGYFGASTGAAAALCAAYERLDIFAVVSRGGRPDLALDYLSNVYAPTLLIVGAEDKQVIPLNILAKNKLKNCQMLTIPNATHLFEEPGTLEKVVEYAVSWFSNSIKLHLAKPASIKENIIEEIEDNSIPFTSVGDLDLWLKEISKHKIIMLGEASHGTKEFYSIRREISKKLMKNYGYNFIAVEGDWPDCYKLNEFIKNGESNSAHEVLQSQFRRWPTWMWANEEVATLLNWMNATKRGAFYGLDIYSLFESIREIKRSLEFIKPEVAEKIMESYKCFESFNFNEIAYAKSLIKLPSGCQNEVVENLRSLLRVRLQETTFSKEALFDVKQNARVMSNAEKYYRSMITGGAESWNVRDTHMMETLQNLLNFHGPDAKAIVWAHNTHIGDYHATNMLEQGHINLGGLAREHYGIENVYLLGFGSFEGEVTAGKSWGGKEEKMVLPKAKEGTYENYFHEASVSMNAPQFLTTFDTLDKNSSLYRKLGHRAVGVVYDPKHETHGNYVPTKMAYRYDGFIFIDSTTALTSLPTKLEKGEFPETWPDGL